MLLITLVIIFAATWCGIYLSKGITVPIQKLAEGTHEVAQGNWDYKIEAGGDDEIGVLMNSFNHMTGDLKQIKLELERRGTSGAKRCWRISPPGSCRWIRRERSRPGTRPRNKCSESQAERAVGRSYQEVFRAEALRGIREIVDSVKGAKASSARSSLRSKISCCSVVVSAATLRDDDGSILGVMVFLEDITQIQKVQRMEAWREVARRIAHEIKNPLTPIQLSARAFAQTLR